LTNQHNIVIDDRPSTKNYLFNLNYCRPKDYSVYAPLTLMLKGLLNEW